MRFDKSIGRPPNEDRASGAHRENIYVGGALFDESGWNNRHAKDISSNDSEDAVTWNVFVGLLGEMDLDVVGAIDGLPGATLRLASSSALVLWNKPIAVQRDSARIANKLLNVLGRVEASALGQSEVEVTVWCPDRRELGICEAKLKAGPGVCKAVSSSYGKRSRDANCRLYRTNKPAQDNGCSYWGEGKGAEAFSARFPENLVSRYLRFQRPIPGCEEQAPCGRLYQLMRNAIIGRVLADDLQQEDGAETSFALTAILAQDYFNPEPYSEFAGLIRDPQAIRFGVITWQGIRDALLASGTRSVADYIKAHTVLG